MLTESVCLLSSFITVSCNKICHGGCRCSRTRDLIPKLRFHTSPHLFLIVFRYRIRNARFWSYQPHTCLSCCAELVTTVYARKANVSMAIQGPSLIWNSPASCQSVPSRCTSQPAICNRLARSCLFPVESSSLTV